MASEAQRLIGISLSKIAQSRSHRGGVSLHKNLLVATVLQKARYIFMEEAYNMVHYQPPVPSPAHHQEAAAGAEGDVAVALTPEEAGADAAVAEPPTACAKCQDKENHPPPSADATTYLDLDKGTAAASTVVLRERSNSTLSLKRRRAIAEWETEEAVQSILPKRSRAEAAAAEDGDDDSVFLDDDAATLLSEAVTKEIEEEDASSAMEIDRITSLVSIFSFSMGDGKLNRSVSAPDLCSAQAKDAQETIQQRQFLAMTV